MSQFTLLHLPQSGPNDTQATLTEWSKTPGQWVAQGEIVGTAETTKSVFDLEAPAAGHFQPIVEVGAEVVVGATIAVVSAEPATAEQVQAWLAAQTRATALPGAPPAAARSWTVKAQVLAQRHNVDLAQVSTRGERITEADVQAYLDARALPTPLPVSSAAGSVHDLVDDRYPAQHSQRLLIIGGGNGAVQILDALARLPGQRAVGVLDDNAALHGKQLAGVPILGAIDVEQALAWQADGLFDAAVISISTSIPARERIFAQWKGRGIRFANVIHPSSVVGMNVTWGEGNVVMALCHFGACATVGDNNFLSAYCSIEHHCTLGSHCSFGPGVVTSSRVQIGDRVRFGTGIFIEPGIRIGADSIIASGLALTQHVPEQSLLKAHLGYARRSRQVAREP